MLSKKTLFRLWYRGAVFGVLFGFLVSHLAYAQNSAASGAAALRPEIDLQLGHLGFVRSIDFSPDGAMIATGSDDTTVKLWDTATGALVQTLKIGAMVHSVDFSPDGVLLAIGAEGNSQLRNARNGALWKPLSGELGRVGTIQFSRDGKLVYGVGNGADNKGRIAIWDAQTGAQLKLFGDYSVPLHKMALSPDETIVAAGGADREVTLWDAVTGQRLRTLEQPVAPFINDIGSIVFYPEGGKLIVSRDDNRVRIYEVSSGKVLKTIQSDRNSAFSMALSAKRNLLAVAGKERPPHLMNATTGAIITRLNNIWVRSVAFSPDGNILAAGEDNTSVTLWDTQAGSVIRTLGSDFSVRSTALSPDNSRLIVGNAARVWNLKTGELERALSAPGSNNCVAWSADGKTCAGGMRDGTIKLWSSASGNILKTLSGHKEDIHTVAFSPDQKLLASAGSDKTVRLWDTATGDELRSLKGDFVFISSLCFSADGKTLWGGGVWKNISVWDVESGQLLQTLTSHTNVVRDVELSPDGTTMASVSADGTLKLWDTATWQLKSSTTLTKEHLFCVAFSPDGKTIVIGDRAGVIRVLDTATRTVRQTVTAHSSPIWSLRFHRDGRSLSSGADDGTIKIWGLDAQLQLRATLFALPAQTATKPDSTEGKPLTADARAITADAREVNEAGDYLVTTSEGYYMGSAQADRFLRFKIGESSFPAESFQARYYRPDLVKKALAGETLPPIGNFKGAYPPLALFDKAQSGTVSGNTSTFIVDANDDSDIKSVAFFVNGARVEAQVVEDQATATQATATQVSGGKPLTADSRDLLLVFNGSVPASYNHQRRFKATLPLPPDAINIKVQAIVFDDDGLQSPRAELLFKREVATTSTATSTGRLLGLCVGISQYRDTALNLQFADADATALSQILSRQSSLYSRAQVEALTNEKATSAAVKTAIDKLMEQTTRTDTVVLLLSGHGWRRDDRNFYFATHEVNRTNVTETALPWHEVTERLTQLSKRSKRVIVLLDACHSGSAASNEELVKAILGANAGVMVFASSKGSEVSLENEEWGHGAFTKALLEAIGGKALEEGEKSVSLWGFANYVRQRVKRLTEGTQNPQVPFLQDFDLDSPLVAAVNSASSGTPAAISQPTETKPADKTPELKTGEILLEGVIKSLDQTKKILVIDVSRFALPNGKTSTLATPKPKSALMQADTQLTRGGAKSLWGGLKEGQRVQVIGTDLGSGQIIPARVIVVLP